MLFQRLGMFLMNKIHLYASEKEDVTGFETYIFTNFRHLRIVSKSDY